MKKSISFILPIYNEEDNIDKFYAELAKTCEALTSKYNLRFIFINDGSKDGSLDRLSALCRRDERITVINFARNFGHQIAVTAGLDNVNEDAAIVMDTDLQDPPKVCLELISKWEDGYDVVFAQRRTRKDAFLKKLTASMFYYALQRLAEIEIPRNTGDFRLVDRKVVNEFKRFNEHNRFLRGLFSYLGYKQTAVVFDRDARYSGKTGYSYKKMMRLAGDGILGFSTFPLKLISRVGYIFSAISFIGILYAVLVKIFDPKVVVPGWTFIVIAILLVGGIQLTMLGVLGGYIGRIYTEVQGRPLYWVESVLGNGSVQPKKTN